MNNPPTALGGFPSGPRGPLRERKCEKNLDGVFFCRLKMNEPPTALVEFTVDARVRVFSSQLRLNASYKPMRRKRAIYRDSSRSPSNVESTLM